MPSVIRNSRIDTAPDKDVDVEIISPTRFVGTHANIVPMFNNAQSPRLFYAARFVNQAMPIKNRETPLVQSLDPEDPDGKSFEDKFGERMGARYFKDDEGEVTNITPEEIEIKLPNGEKKYVDLYNNFQFNRKTQLSNKPIVKVGDKLKKGQLLASSNFTDDNGTVSMGINARVALVPYKGYSMDDAIVVSESFAKRLTSEHNYAHELSKEGDLKFGKTHYTSLFPRQFTKDQLSNLDDNGVVKPGTVLHKGDPIILATKPKAISSNSHLGKLGKTFRQMRTDATEVWDHDYPGVVTDSVYGKKNARVFVNADVPLKVGDKQIMRNGQKDIVSLILPDEQMPRSLDGTPFEVLLNPLALPSRVNTATPYELLLGKLASLDGKPLKVPAFNKAGTSRLEEVKKELAKRGISDTEEIFDPMTNRKLEKPVTTGIGYFYKLHHVVDSKVSARGQGSYDCYSEDTEVLTRRGWVAWPEVTSSDEFFTVDKCFNSFYVKPIRLIKQYYEGDMIGFRSKHIDVLTTPNHKHYVQSPKTKRYSKITAEELYGKTQFFVKQFGFKSVYDTNTTGDFITISHDPVKRGSRMRTYESVTVNKIALAKLIGIWLADGQLVTKGRYRIVLYQQTIANAYKCKEIDSILAATGLDYTIHVRKNGMKMWSICCPVLALFMEENFGKCAYNKYIPQWVIEESREFREALMYGYMLGDGCIQTDKRNGHVTEAATTISKALAESLQLLAVSLGYGAMCKEYPARYRNFPGGGSYKCKAFWGITFHRKRKVAGIRKIPPYKAEHYRVPYNGYIYCATLPGEGLLYVRRNGKPILSGNSNEQPIKGGGEGAQAKRLGGLETTALMAHGAYSTLREGATLRGQKNDDYWRLVRQGYTPAEPGKPFVWDKFKALLNGAGYMARDLGKGTLRLSPFTDKDLARLNPVELKNAKSVNIGTLEPEPGGLFDSSIVAGNKWGKITLPSTMPNPAFEKQIQQLLGITNADMRKVIAGEMTLKEAQSKKTKR